MVRIQDGSKDGLQPIFEKELTVFGRVVLLFKSVSYHEGLLIDLDYVVKVGID